MQSVVRSGIEFIRSSRSPTKLIFHLKAEHSARRLQAWLRVRAAIVFLIITLLSCFACKIQDPSVEFRDVFLRS